MTESDLSTSQNLPVIKCYITEQTELGDYLVVAVDAQDGEQLAVHLSSSQSHAKYDIGITSQRKHDKYRAKYPQGYELHWID